MICVQPVTGIYLTGISLTNASACIISSDYTTYMREGRLNKIEYDFNVCI
jgi:hypothetical protein